MHYFLIFLSLIVFVVFLWENYQIISVNNIIREYIYIYIASLICVEKKNANTSKMTSGVQK